MRRLCSSVVLLAMMCAACGDAADRDALVRSELVQVAENIVTDPGAAGEDLPDGIAITATSPSGDDVAVATLTAQGPSGSCYAVQVAFPAAWLLDGDRAPSAGPVEPVDC